MNRQMKRRFTKNLNLKESDIDELSEYFRKQNEEVNKELIIKFLGLTVEALRLEFGFGQKRIEQYGARLDSLLDSINLGYVTFEDLLEEMSIKPTQILKIDYGTRDKIEKRLKKEA